MTKLLERAISEVKKLPSAEQDAIAALILDEITDEKMWDDAFTSSQPQLAKWAERVRRDIHEGKVKEMGIDEL